MTVNMFSPAHARSLCEARAMGVPAVAAGQDLAAFLYTRWYAAPRADVRLDPAWPPLEGMLRLAQQEALGWQAATAVGQGAGGVVVARGAGGRARALLRGGYTHVAGSGRTGLPVQPGEDVVAVPRSGGVTSEGWWRSWGCGWDPRTAPEGTTRVYLSPAVWELPSLVGALTVALEEHAEPWMVKVAAHAESLGRPDAVVVYLASTAAFGAIGECATGRVQDHAGPPLTGPLSPGVAWAQDPGDGRSFGESRCSLVAAAMLRSLDGDDQSFLRAAAEEFTAAGLDPAAPHMGRPANA
ncbi:T3SS effector HopA1 family protein [Arthrobacter sp. HY1533]|uniref:T3SS effector HopA1 family protein n=1 Tax=Arthrobacter sp. HY1533 TaxID=2970919 RepID=UPI0022BA078E|nr:T3SS effector HopA1 family protein [Arthrobacter sp. HY1533]